MNTIKIALLALGFAALAGTTLSAQSGMVKKQASATAVEEKTESFEVLGNCGMCKSTIEKAAKAAGAAKADWDKEKDLLTVSFDPAKTSTDAIQKAVAMSGYDNVGYRAPDEAYEKLHACCHYDRSGRPSTAKPCTEEDAPKN